MDQDRKDPGQLTGFNLYWYPVSNKPEILEKRNKYNGKRYYQVPAQ